MKKVTFQKAQYLGGLPGTKATKAAVNLFVTDDGVGHGMFGPKSPISWDEIAGIGFETGTAAKSRAGKVMAFGVLGLAGRKSQNEANITVQKANGDVALWRVEGKSGHQVRGGFQAFMTAKGVPCLDDAPAAADVVSETAPTSVADEIAKLAELHKAGVLTDEEFAAHKANLLT